MSPVVFFDLDGVLADFVRGAFRLHGRSVPMRDVRWGFPAQIGFKDEHDPAFWRPMNRAYWSGLDRLPDGFALLSAVEHMLSPERIGLLTSAAGEDGCIDGKRDWVTRHLPGHLARLFTGSAKHLFAGPNKVLVDDNDSNVFKFGSAGGLTVLVPRPWNKRGDECDSEGGFDPDAIAEEVRDALQVANRFRAA